MKLYFETEFGKIYQGNCIDVLKDIDITFDMLLTDPPYLIGYKTNHRKNKNHDYNSEILGDSNNEYIISEVLKHSFDKLKNNSAAYVFCHWKTSDYFAKEIAKYSSIKNKIIWVKNNWTAGDLKQAFGYQYEIIIMSIKGRKEFIGKRFTDVWKFDRVSGNKQLHQNQKPISLLMRCMWCHTNKGDTIFDPFGGSGSTAVAAQLLERKWIIVEQEEKYCEIAKQRIVLNS